MGQNLRPSNFEFFTNRPELVVGKLPEKDAEVEYVCPHCSFYEIKRIQMNRGVTASGKPKKKLDRPEFNCSKCGKTIKVLELKKV